MTTGHTGSGISRRRSGGVVCVTRTDRGSVVRPVVPPVGWAHDRAMGSVRLIAPLVAALTVPGCNSLKARG
jgi:hypothetical protein